VVPQSKALEIKGKMLNYRFPAASVTKLELSLA